METVLLRMIIALFTAYHTILLAMIKNMFRKTRLQASFNYDSAKPNLTGKFTSLEF